MQVQHCRGKAFIEGATYKIHSYFPFNLCDAFVVLSFVAFKWISGSDGKLESALNHILGTIVGFYFGGKAKW